MATKTKLMICLMAFSVALTGYLSCLIASHIRWGVGLVTAPAILPGLAFGLAIAAWLLHRGWISRGKAVGLAVGSAMAYFAAYWSAFYLVALCGKGMLFSTVRLALFHAGMIAGLVGTTLLIASLAAVSADFRRKHWKTLFLIGAAAGGALCLAGIGAGASSNDRAGTLANPGDMVFIFVWQLLVSGYLGMLLLAAPGSSKPAERGRTASWATRAVLVLLVASFVQAAIKYSRGDEERKTVSSATSANSNTQPSPPPQVADIEALGRAALQYMQAFDDELAALSRGDALEVVDAAREKRVALEQESNRAAGLLKAAAAAGNERAAAIISIVRKRNEERTERMIALWKKSTPLVLSDGRRVRINDDDGEYYATKDPGDHGVKLTGAAKEEAQRLRAEWDRSRKQDTGNVAPSSQPLPSASPNIDPAVAEFFAILSGGAPKTRDSGPRSENSLAVERYLRSRLIGGATENQIVELSNAIAKKFDAANLSPKDRAACISGSGDQRQILLYQLKGEVWREEDRKYHDTAAKPLIVDIHRMIPRRAVFRDLFYDGNTSKYSPKKALPAIDEPIAVEGKPPGSLAREHLEPIKSVIYDLTPFRKNPSETPLGFWMKVEKLEATDVLYSLYQSEERDNWFHPVYFWYQNAPKGLEELLKTLPADHPIRLIGPARESAPNSYVMAMQANQEAAALVRGRQEDLEKWRAAEAERKKKAGGGFLDYLAKMAELGMKLGQQEKEQARQHYERVEKIIAESGGKKIKCPTCNGSGTVLDSTYNHQTNPYPLLSLEHGQFEESREGVRIIACNRCSKTGVVDK